MFQRTTKFSRETLSLLATEFDMRSFFYKKIQSNPTQPGDGPITRHAMCMDGDGAPEGRRRGMEGKGLSEGVGKGEGKGRKGIREEWRGST